MAPSSVLVQYLVCLALGYLIGSFPTAYLLVRWRRRLDIRSAGTGNVGAMNTYDTTGSKLLGFAVLGVDVAKGAAAALLAAELFPGSFWGMAWAGIAAVAGHCFSPWLRFRGGRGLATSAGVMLVTAWAAVLIWVCIWGLHFAVSRNLHGANIVATVVTPVALLLLPAPLAAPMLAHGEQMADVVLLFAAMGVFILIRHRDFFRTSFTSSTNA